MYGIIYKATNMINGKCYIGKTVRPLKVRMKRHFRDAIYLNQTIFHRAIVKYGENNFKFTIIDEANNPEELNEKEIYWIKYYKSFIHDSECNGYNMTIGGDGMSGEFHPFFGREVPNETKEKIRNTLKARNGGRNLALSKAVYQFTLEGHLINRHASISDAHRYLGLKSGGHVSIACRGRLHSAHGFIWILEEDLSDELLKAKVEAVKNKSPHNKRRVVQLDLDGSFIRIHDSFNDAIKSVSNSSSSGNIVNCCKGILKQAYGYRWAYEDEYRGEGIV